MEKLVRKPWSEDDRKFLEEHLGYMTLKDIGDALGRSEMSVRLYVHRKRSYVGPAAKRNIVQRMLGLRYRHLEDFTPSRAFYNETGIGQKRWWDLYHGRKALRREEYLALAKYLDVTLEEAFESRQLSLFEEERDD